MKSNMTNKFGIFGKDRFPPYEYQSKVGINARELLHNNSKEIVKILNDLNIIKNDIKIFEMGAGGARNLYYIWNNNKTVKLYCNDLSREASFAQMHPDVRGCITFFEGDSEEIIASNVLNDIDVFLVSDHFMHLQYEKAENIISEIMKNWLPKFIVLREVKKEFESPMHPKLYHNYDRFLEQYDLLHESSSENDNTYFIWVLKKKFE